MDDNESEAYGLLRDNGGKSETGFVFHVVENPLGAYRQAKPGAVN